ncbi:MAG: hypothetical protein K9M75_08690 [Phycisphaerae bacterium]|nr:hypothetical protein [Phycisphaerae bacterium]
MIIGAALATIGFGGFLGAKFKRIYLDPWPNDDIRDSVFMRMTASNVKPFDVCQFMRDNELSGKMFNYWTEGGALAFGQCPDPKTGKIPLQLFMDGRAQAAYDHSNFQLWRYLYAGGPGVNDARRAGRYIKPGSAEMKEVGEFLNEEMKKRDIWVFVLPTSQFRPDSDPIKVNYFPLALSEHPEWVLVYMDDHQQMYVNQTMKKGKELLNKVLNKKAKFPTEYSEYLTLSRLYMRMGGAKSLEGFELGKKAFEVDQTQAAMIQISFEAGRYPHLSRRGVKYITDYVDDFVKNKKAKSKEGGYAKKLEAAYIGASYLSKVYEKTDAKKANEYLQLTANFTDERKQIAHNYKW